MEIVAVIPARINTKRVPNKMLRIVGGHPLVYYAIQNAKKSKYITKIIVSTDSEQIKVVAEQFGVSCIMRDKEICGDEIPLDIVVYDAVRNIDAQCVITLQPTSPLLKVETLDAAIAFFIENNYDTLISVHNEPKLAWEKTSENCWPQYQKRLNSQYLPPHYVETGAFLISKKNCIKPYSRIGKRVDIWETSSIESVGVCELQDLALVEMLMNCKKVAFYVNGNAIRGMGHIYRVLELADEFYVKPDIYYNKRETDRGIFGHTDYEVFAVESEEDLLEKLEKKDYDILINDILDTSRTYMLLARKNLSGVKIVNFEDKGEGSELADLVINALYQDNAHSNVRSGAKYYISPKNFLCYEPISVKEDVQNVLVTFGGADPMDYTTKVLDIIGDEQEKYKLIEFYVIVGRACKKYEKIRNHELPGNIHLLYDIKNMPEVMSKCDVAISSRGRTAFELALMGIPAVVIAQNKQEQTHEFISDENGFDYLGINPSCEIIKNHLDGLIWSGSNERFERQQQMLKNDLRNGRQRVIHLIRSL